MSSRQAALLMHAIDPSDRHWLLSQLPEADQSVLNAHLTELSELGIPADPTIRHSISIDSAHQDARDLSHATLAEINALLSCEPIWMQAQILACGPWLWQETWLANQEPERRKSLASYLQASPQGAPVARALACRQILTARWQQQLATQQVQPLPAHGFPSSTLGQWIRKWLP